MSNISFRILDAIVNHTGCSKIRWSLSEVCNCTSSRAESWTNHVTSHWDTKSSWNGHLWSTPKSWWSLRVGARYACVLRTALRIWHIPQDGAWLFSSQLSSALSALLRARKQKRITNWQLDCLSLLPIKRTSVSIDEKHCWMKKRKIGSLQRCNELYCVTVMHLKMLIRLDKDKSVQNNTC